MQGKTIVFVDYKKDAAEYENLLCNHVPSRCLHGDIPQVLRWNFVGRATALKKACLLPCLFHFYSGDTRVSAGGFQERSVSLSGTACLASS